MALRIVVSGATGRMGRELARLAAATEDVELVGGIARRGGDGDYPQIRTVEDAADLIERADAVLDFSAPPQTGALLERHGSALEGRALVVGTTGLDPEHEAALDSVARHAAVVVAANFSIGVNVLLALVEQAARMLPPDRYDIEVVEAHHRGKADAPSGTALALGQAIAAVRGEALERLRRDGRSGHTGERPRGELGFHAVRGGGVAGEHRVLLLGERERLELTHSAAGRDLFAEGALHAARWAVGRGAGRYTMAQLIAAQG